MGAQGHGSDQDVLGPHLQHQELLGQSPTKQRQAAGGADVFLTSFQALVSLNKLEKLKRDQKPAASPIGSLCPLLGIAAALFQCILCILPGPLPQLSVSPCYPLSHDGAP